MGISRDRPSLNGPFRSHPGQSKLLICEADLVDRTHNLYLQSTDSQSLPVRGVQVRVPSFPTLFLRWKRYRRHGIETATDSQKQLKGSSNWQQSCMQFQVPIARYG